ncbi:MAG: GrdX protein [Bacillota bacterium]|nr:MAG: GrdX protein [Bacillota bacterium]MBS3949221.1 GrdX family protein [Peptococcaceae bacterium]
MRYITIVSNNPTVELTSTDIHVTDYGVVPVLERVRDLVHLGHHLLTHPFAGSVKPNENPFRSVVVTKGDLGVDYQSVQIAEGCLEVARRMVKERPYRDFPTQAIKDLQLIDKSLLDSGLESLRMAGKL